MGGVCACELGTHHVRSVVWHGVCPDRQHAIAHHNLILLDRLEKIRQQQVPKHSDVSHLSEEILNAPRATNALLRRRQQEKIETENAEMHKRLQKTKGTFSNKQLAVDADKHRYLASLV